MRGFFYQDFRRSITGKGFFAGMLLISMLVFHAVAAGSVPDGSRSYLHTLGDVFHASGLSPFAAIFPVMAYATALCEEYQSEYLQMILVRCGLRRFIRVRIATVALSGGIMMALPILLVCITAYLGGAHGLPAGVDEGLLEGSRALIGIEKYGDWYFLVWKVVLGFLFGVLWALVGLAFSAFIPNRYVGLLAPFILYDSLWLFMGDLPMNPVFLLSGDNVLHGNFPLAALFEILYIGVTILIAAIGIRRLAYA